MNNYIPLFYMNTITYPRPNPCDGLANRYQKDSQGR